MRDELYYKTYDKNNYNCAHFARDVYLAETGKDIGDTLSGFLLPPSKRVVQINKRHRLTRLDRPVSPCLVIMLGNKIEPHVGVFLRDKLIHITKRGVMFVSLAYATYGYSKLGYYKC
jgi:hypothetical protein